MKPTFKPETIKRLIAVLIFLFLIKLLWFIVEIVWFPVEGVNHVEDRSAKPLYYRVKLTRNDAPPPTVKPKEKIKMGSIKDITLLAVYNASDATVVTVKYKGKTKVLGKGESVNGFVLESAGANFATFTKGGKSYKIELYRPKTKKGKGVITPVSVSPIPKTGTAVSDTSEVNGEIVDAGDHKIVDRSLFEHYTKNIDDLYKNIGIQEVKNEGRIIGFKVTFVKRGSPIAKLGVKRGDVIKAINGQELTSYSAALNAYKDIDKAENITLVIERKNQEMELEYEIN